MRGVAFYCGVVERKLDRFGQRGDVFVELVDAQLIGDRETVAFEQLGVVGRGELLNYKIVALVVLIKLDFPPG